MYVRVRSQLFALLLGIIIVSGFIAPLTARAFPFGGQTQVHHYCYNAAIYAQLGPPRGGPYIWVPSTKTYQFGPPRGVGQWLLGLTGPPYYCVVTRSPIFVKEGISIMMMGSSGPAAPARPSTGLGGIGLPSPGPTPMPQPTPVPPTPGTTVLGKVVISEVYAYVDTTRGTDPLNEWVEIYNGSASTVDLSNWILADASSTDALPTGTTLEPGKILVVAATTTTRVLWAISSSTPFVSLGNSIGNGLAGSGDALSLRRPNGAVVDALSWGNNRSVFNPAAPVVVLGQSLGRTSFETDADSASDWALRAPNPGN